MNDAADAIRVLVPGWRFKFDAVSLRVIADAYLDLNKTWESDLWRQRADWLDRLWKQLRSVANGAAQFGCVERYGDTSVEFWRTPKCVRCRVWEGRGLTLRHCLRPHHGQYWRLGFGCTYAVWLRCWSLMVDLDWSWMFDNYPDHYLRSGDSM